MTTPLWTWGGCDFGHRDGDELRTYDGRHVGHFHGADGSYLGELQHDDHLITRTAKLPQHRKAFTPLPDRPGRAAFIGFNGFELPKGYQDFPSPDALR
jgi:hypothetical protein